MKNNPLISVIVPCYNSEKTILETLDSINKQSYSNIEIIVVNDGSIDNTANWASNYSSDSHFPLTVINQTNKGLSAARNTGAKNAKGKYLHFLDSDDKIMPTYILNCIKILESQNEIKMVYAKAQFFEALDKPMKLPSLQMPHFLLTNCIPSASGIISMNTYNEIGGFDENLNYTEDWEFWIRLVKKYGEKSIYRINEKLFFYRKRLDKSSMTDLNTNDNKEDDAFLYIYNKHKTFYLENKLSISEIKNSYKYKFKYYDVWYKKLFYFLFSKK